MWCRVLLFLFAALAFAQPKRVLYVTHTAGFRHDSIALSRQVMANLSPQLEVVHTEDLAQLTAANLANYDALFFFTSGELALSDAQKTAILAFVRDGKGFGGAHSATDTLYGWPEYGEMIGAYFDGHPWAEEVTMHVEDPGHPLVAHLPHSFRFSEEVYQFRAFSRDRVRVLLSLDAASVDLNREGVNRADRDFALTWVREYGRGRVFYTAHGHGDETWADRRFQEMLRQGVLFITRQIDAAAEPRNAAPAIFPGGAVDALTYTPQLRAGGYLAIFGAQLTTGAQIAGGPGGEPLLGGTSVFLNGVRARLLYASPGQINVRLPEDLPRGREVEIVVRAAGAVTPPVRVAVAP